MTRRITSLIAKKRLTIIYDNGDIVITAPPDTLSPPTTFDIRCKVNGTLLARLDTQGLSIKCNWCHEVQTITREQLNQMQEEATDELTSIYCANCMQKGRER